MQGLVLLSIVGVIVWDGVARKYNPTEGAGAPLKILLGTLPTLMVTAGTVGLHHLCQGACVPVGVPGGE